MSVIITVTVPRQYVRTMNDRYGWHERAERTKTIRQLAAYAKLGQARAATFDRLECRCTIYHRTRQRRDAHNWMPTAKDCVDGMVGGPSPLPKGAAWPHRLLPDDSDQHLTGPDLRNAVDATLSGAIRLEFVFTEGAS